MKINLSARHFEASEKLQKFAVSKVERLEKFSGRNLTADLILEQNNALKKVELRISLLGRPLQAVAEGDDFFKIIPLAVSKMEKQIKATKEKVYGK